MGQKKRQHFVPQSYLKLFSNDDKNIWVYDKKAGTIRSQRILKTGFMRNYYSTGIHDAPLETSHVTSLESDASQIIKKIQEGNIINGKEWGVLLNYVSLQYLRTPKAEKRLREIFALFWKKIRELKVRYPKNNKIKELINSFPNKDLINNPDDSYFMENIEESFPRELFIETLVSQGFNIAKMLSEQNINVHVSTNVPFITSDDPFAVFQKNNNEGYHKLTADVNKIIPLSSKITLSIGGQVRFNSQIRSMNDWQVKIFNLGTAHNADRFVYSNSKAVLENTMKLLPDFQKNPGKFIPKHLIDKF